MLMDYDPEFSVKSNAELNYCLTKYSDDDEHYARAVAELSKRGKAAEARITAKFALPGSYSGSDLPRSSLFPGRCM
jgi:hypothetical protein